MIKHRDNLVFGEIELPSENTFKGAKSTKAKVLFQGLHMTHVIFMLVYNFKFYILGTPFNT
jgi:hypothetical protein